MTANETPAKPQHTCTINASNARVGADECAGCQHYLANEWPARTTVRPL